MIQIMSDLVFPAPWLCATLVIPPLGILAAHYLRFIDPLPFRQVWYTSLAASLIISALITDVTQRSECLLLATACFACTFIAWNLGLWLRRDRA
jgi:hypothetical protein